MTPDVSGSNMPPPPVAPEVVLEQPTPPRCLPQIISGTGDRLAKLVRSLGARIANAAHWPTSNRWRLLACVALLMGLVTGLTWLGLFAGLFAWSNLLAIEFTVVLAIVCRRPLREETLRVYWRLLAADPILMLIAAFMLLIVWGVVGDGFGIFYLFWHERPGVTFLAGAGVALFWCTVAAVSFLLFRHTEHEAAPAVGANNNVAGLDAAFRTMRWLLFPPLYLCLLPIVVYQAPQQVVETTLAVRQPTWIEGFGQSILSRLPFFMGTFSAVCVVWVIVRLWPLARINARQDDPNQRDQTTGWFAWLRRFFIFVLTHLLPLSALAAIGLVLIDRLWIRVPGLTYVLLEIGIIVVLESVVRFSPPRIEQGSPLYDRARARLWWTKYAAVLTALFLITIYADNLHSGVTPGPWFLLLLIVFVSLAMSAWMQHQAFRSRFANVDERLQCWSLRLLLIAILVGTPFMLLIELTGYAESGIAAMVVTFWMLLLVMWLWARGWRPSAAQAGIDERLELHTRSFFFFALVAFIFLWILHQVRDLTEDENVLFPPASMTITILVAGIVLAYGWLRSFRRGRFVALLLLLLLAHAYLNSWELTPHRLVELEKAGYYALENRLSSDEKQPDNYRPSLAHYEQLRIANQGVGLKDGDVLPRWKSSVAAPPGGRPPLIVVTTSGGASAAAIFTLIMLTELERQRPGITRYVRIITGASGGMLGAAYYRSALPDFWKLDDAARHREIERMLDAQSSDFLSPVVQQWVFKDMPLALCPRFPTSNRGRALDLVWHKELNQSLKKTFAVLASEERDGRCPSIIFSPVLVEDGRQLLISTLDLNNLVALTPSRAAVGAASLEPSPLQAVEFFKLFPKATNLELATAVRLNATFPFLTPAATLPTVPPRRVMDAGFYDNHGIQVAAAWIYANRKWLMENTSEVIVLQLRPFQKIVREHLSPAVTDDELDQFLEARRKKKELSNLGDSLLTFRELLTPVESGVNTLQSAMVLRNSQQLRMLQDLMPASANGDYRGVSSYTFVGGAQASLNWYLPPHQVMELEMVVRKQVRAKWPSANVRVLGEKESFKRSREWNDEQFSHLLQTESIKKLP